VGGGTSGWIMASVLSRIYKSNHADPGISIRLIESPTIGTIGVGEATVPSFIDLLSFLEVPGKEFIRETNATIKLGIKFKNWQGDGQEYWHPFGQTGVNLNGLDFFQFWSKASLYGDLDKTYTDFSPSAAVGELGNVTLPGSHQNDQIHPVLRNVGYALHFDAGLAAAFLSRYAIENGVTHIPANISDVVIDDDGFIKSVKLEDGEAIEGDLFFDCTGQYGLLIGKTLGIGYNDWQQFLPVDKAAVVQSSNTESFPPYTQATAHQHGWRWRIPLRNRTGNGYVFCSHYCDDQEAIELLLSKLEGEPLNEPRIISFKTGVRKKLWHKNCVAIGLASGFLEPLESTGIYLIGRGALTFARMIPDKSFDQATQDEYNRLMSMEYECLRDFIVMHYCTSTRNDSEFWQDWQRREIPESLKRKLSLYKSQGRLVYNEIDLFQSNSWHSVLTGMGVIPEAYDPIVDNIDFKSLLNTMKKFEVSIQSAAAAQKSHRRFLDELLANCA
jgi:tryptophan halogenase